MPNWSSNALITTNPDIIQKLRECAVANNEDILAAFIPPPAALDNIVSGMVTLDGKTYSCWRVIDGKNVAISDEEMGELQQNYGATSNYDWYINNYGTKWDACNTEFTTIGDHEIVVHFDTAWSPPEEWLLKVVILHPQGETRLAYAEGGTGYFGVVAYRDGELIEEKCVSDNFWKDDGDYDDDLEDRLTPECWEHISAYGLHTGG